MEKCTNNDTPVQRTYVLGRKSFAAITAIEGLKLRSTSEKRLRQTETLSPEQRRAETIRAFAGSRVR